MRRFTHQFIRAALIGLLSGCPQLALARLTGTAPATADIFCVGPSGAEACVDSSGGFLPTTDNDAALGTSSLRWSDVQTLDLTVGDDLTVSDISNIDTLGLTKTALGSGQSTVAGIYTATTVVVTSSYMSLISSGTSDVLLNSTPSVSTGPSTTAVANWASGTLVIFTSTSSAGVIFQDEGTLTGSRLQLGAATRLVNRYDILTLIYDATDNFWREVSFSAN